MNTKNPLFLKNKPISKQLSKKSERNWKHHNKFSSFYPSRISIRRKNWTGAKLWVADMKLAPYNYVMNCSGKFNKSQMKTLKTVVPKGV